VEGSFRSSINGVRNSLQPMAHMLGNGRGMICKWNWKRGDCTEFLSKNTQQYSWK